MRSECSNGADHIGDRQKFVEPDRCRGEAHAQPDTNHAHAPGASSPVEGARWNAPADGPQPIPKLLPPAVPWETSPSACGKSRAKERGWNDTALHAQSCHSSDRKRQHGVEGLLESKIKKSRQLRPAGQCAKRVQKETRHHKGVCGWLCVSRERTGQLHCRPSARVTIASSVARCWISHSPSLPEPAARLRFQRFAQLRGG